MQTADTEISRASQQTIADRECRSLEISLDDLEKVRPPTSPFEFARFSKDGSIVISQPFQYLNGPAFTPQAHPFGYPAACI